MSNKFKDFLSEPQQFTEWEWVVTAEWSKKEFYEFMKENYSDFKEMSLEEFLERVKEDWVHFHIDGGSESYDMPMWWLGSEWIRGAKKVFTY